MKVIDFIKKAEELVEEHTGEYDYIGIRFEDKVRTVDELIEDYSRSNPDREDEREFPEFGTEEYFEMEELDGICAYNAKHKYGWGTGIDRSNDYDVDVWYNGSHCYLLGSNSMEYGEDDGELIMRDAIVLEVLY